MTQTKLSAPALKSELWETLKQVKAKRIKPEVANAVANQSREIMRIVKAEIQIAQMQGKQPSDKLLSAELSG